jgi:hypothetical protein
MEAASVRAVAAACLCPALWTSDQYRAAIAAAGLRLLRSEDLTAKVIPTWEICLRRARAARVAVALLPRPAREFVQAIDLIVAAYTAGELTYTVMSAEKPIPTPGDDHG